MENIVEYRDMFNKKIKNWIHKLNIKYLFLFERFLHQKIINATTIFDATVSRLIYILYVTSVFHLLTSLIIKLILWFHNIDFFYNLFVLGDVYFISAIIGVLYFITSRLYFSFVTSLLFCIFFLFGMLVKRIVLLESINIHDFIEIPALLSFLPFYLNFYVISSIILYIVLGYFFFKKAYYEDNEIREQQKVKIPFMHSVCFALPMFFIFFFIVFLKIAPVQYTLTEQHQNVKRGIYVSFYLSWQGQKYYTSYTEENMENIREKYGEIYPVILPNGERINVVYYLLESFHYPEFYGIHYKKDPIPNIREIISQYPSGTNIVNVFGGHTATTVLDILTGIGYHPTKENVAGFYYNFSGITPTVVDFFNDNDYETFFLGDYRYHSYTQNIPRIGFDHAKDANEYEVWHDLFFDEIYVLDFIKGEWEKTDKDRFFFIQSATLHMPLEHRIKDHFIENREDLEIIESPVTNQKNKDFFKKYGLALQRVDESIGNLTNYFKEKDEKVLIIFFSDHQYGIKEFLEENNELNGMEAYKVPYFLWANYPIDSKYSDLRSINRYSHILFEELGLKEYPYQFEHFKKIMGDYSVFNPRIYIKKGEDEFKYPKDIGKELEKKIEEYMNIEYDIMRKKGYLDRHRTNTIYEPFISPKKD